MAVATVEREAQWGPVRGRGSRTSWGAIFSGALATLGIWVLLSSLGGAIGWTLFNPGRVPGGYGLGLFSSIWGIVAPLVSFFVGGVVAGRLSGAVTRASGGLHGLVVWSLTGLALLLLGGLVLDLRTPALDPGRRGDRPLALGGLRGADPLARRRDARRERGRART